MAYEDDVAFNSMNRATKSDASVFSGKETWDDKQWDRYNKGVANIREYITGTSRDKMFPDTVENGGYKNPKFDKFEDSLGEDSDFSRHLGKNLEMYQTPGKVYGSDYNKSFKGMTDILEKSVTEGSSYWDD